MQSETTLLWTFFIKQINTLFTKLIPFIVDHWENAGKETRSRTKGTWSPIWEHQGTYSLASWSTCLSAKRFSSACVAGGWPFPSHHPCRWRKWFLVTSESATCWEGISFAVVDCIPVLFGKSIGITCLWWYDFPHAIIGPDSTTASVSLSSSAFQFPLEPAPLAANANILYEWTCPSLPIGCLLHTVSQSRGILIWTSRNLNVGHLPDF